MSKERDRLVNRLRATWTAIGDPEPGYFVLLVKSLSKAWAELEDEEIGMVVLAVPRDIAGNDVGIAVDRDAPHLADMPFRFADEWRGRSQ